MIQSEKKREKKRVLTESHSTCPLIKWYLGPSQPLGIISGLKETFIKIYVLEKTNKADIRTEEQIEKMENCQENLWSEIQLNGPQRHKQTQEQK